MNNPGIIDSNQKIVGSGLVLNIDAAQRRSYPTTGTTWFDLSGNNYSGSFTGSPLPTYTSTNGGSINFAGGAQGISYIAESSIPDSFWNAGSWTVSAWVKLNIVNSPYPDDNSIVGHGSSAANLGLHLGERGTKVQFGFFGNDLTGNITLSTNTFYNIVWIFNFTTKLKSIYVNSVFDASGGTVGYSGTGSNTRIGSYPLGFGLTLNGSVYNMVLYNRVLSATEVLNNFNAIKSRFGYFPVITSGLQLYLSSVNTTSNPGSGTAWNDISGNNRNFNWVSTPTRGTDTGVPYFTTYGNRCTGPASNSFGITNTTGYTVFLVMKQLSLINSSAFKFYSSNGGAGTSAGRGIFSHCTWSDDNIYFDQGGCCNADQRTNVASGGLTAWNIIVFRSTVATRSIFKNATSLVTNSTAAANINLTTTGVDLGGTDEGSTWDARIAGFLVYNRGLSDAEISQNVQILRSQFGM